MKNTSINILLTGSKGQLGRSVLKVMGNNPEYRIMDTDMDSLDITSEEQLNQAFQEFSPHFCINAAAYTAVDRAETDIEMATRINTKASSFLAKLCKKYQTTLIHISTDYVYHSILDRELKETDTCLPKGIYAKTKLEGENQIKAELQEYIIIRTSWLYSEFGNNFVKTMLHLAKSGKDLRVVDDQFGSPTYASDLAVAIQTIIDRLQENSSGSLYGIYNFSNLGETSWYEFARLILKQAAPGVKITPVKSEEYKTPAPRPRNSRLSKEKIQKNFMLEIPQWEDSLEACLQKLEKEKQ